MSDELETVDLEGIPIMAANVRVFGGGACPPEGEVYTVERLQAIADHTNEVVTELRPFNKLGHSEEQALAHASGFYADDEIPATGNLENFRVEGEELVVDAKGTPKKLAALLKAGAFSRRSPEIIPYKAQGTEVIYPEVVRALSWLGAKVPAFRTIDQIATELYSDGAQERPATAALYYSDAKLSDPEVKTIEFSEGDVVWSPDQSYQSVMDDLRGILNPGDGTETKYWVNDISSDRTRALVCEYDAGGDVYWVVPITVGADGTVSASDSSSWTMAEQAWVEAAASRPSPPASAATASEYAADEGVAMTNAAPDDTRGAVAEETTAPDAELSAEDKTLLARLVSFLKGAGEAPELDPGTVKAFAEVVGLDETAKPEEVLEAIKAKVTEAEAPVTGESRVPDGMKLMSADEVAELRSMAQIGVTAAEQLRVERRDTFLGEAERTGRIPVADRDEWAKRYDENADWTRAVIEKLQPDENIIKTFGADDDGDQFNLDEMNEAQYEAFCHATGTPYVPREGTESAAA